MFTMVQWFDDGVLYFFLSWRQEFVVEVFKLITAFGNTYFILSLAVLLGIFLLWKRQYADFGGFVVAVIGSGFVVGLLKYLVNRPRPPITMQAYLEGPFHSFPSGHAALSMAFYGFVVYLLLQMVPTNMRRFLVICLPALILLIGVSRLYLGVHYLTDVLAGFAVGALFVWFGILSRLHLLIRQDSPHE